MSTLADSFHTAEIKIFSCSVSYSIYNPEMHLSTHATLGLNPTPFTKYLTTFDPSPTLTGHERPTPLNIFTPPTTGPVNVQTSRRIVWQTPNVVMDDIPTTLVTVTTTAHATRWVTLPAPSVATVPAADSLLTSATATQHAAVTSNVELADVGEGIPDWPPLLIIFLLCWVTVAWAVALVLYLATFPEKVAWLDRLLARLRGRKTGHGERYVRVQNDSNCSINDEFADMSTPPATVVQNPPGNLLQPSLPVWVSLLIIHQIRHDFAGHAPSTQILVGCATPAPNIWISLLPRHCPRMEVSKCSRRVQARQRATWSASITSKT